MRRPPDAHRRGGARGRPRRPTPRGPVGRIAAASSLAVSGAAGRDRVCVGAVLGAHGIAGSVRVKSFTADPAAVAIYGPVSDEAGERTFVLSVAAVRPDSVIVRIEGVADREAATALRGTRLYVARDRLPEPDADEFYHADLLGLAAATPDGEAFGRIVAVHESGAGDTLEIARDGGLPPAMVPFTRAAVPEVDLRAGRVVVVPDSVVAEDQGEEAP